MRGKEKLNYLASIKHFNEIEWQRIIPDKTHNWLTENLLDEFKSQSFFPMGSKDAKAARSTEIGGAEIHTIFKLYSPGVQTNRDSWMYDFDEDRLAAKANGMINTYNIEVTRWLKSGC